VKSKYRSPRRRRSNCTMAYYLLKHDRNCFAKRSERRAHQPTQL